MSLIFLFQGASPIITVDVPVWNPGWVPDFVFTQSYAFDTIITDIEIGPESRRSRRSVSVATFTLNFEAITKALAASIMAFYVDCRGPFKTFQWANIVDGVTYDVRFLEGSLSREEVGEDLINMTVKLKQVL